MRIWDIPAEKLCDKHLLGEHRELHAIWNIITENKKGYSNHPETLRWRGKLKALYNRHKQQVKEMKERGYKHKSSLNVKKAVGKEKQNCYIDSIEKQEQILKDKKCKCKI
ncbi:MAG: pyrimidine dimer DNA glycosylase/endonuclease V [Candidatus Thermoplasmatota archaeon]